MATATALTLGNLSTRSFLPDDNAQVVAVSTGAETCSLTLTEDERNFFEGKTTVPGFRTYGDLSRHMTRNSAPFLR